MQEWRDRAVSAEEVLRSISNGMNLFVHGAAATPLELLRSLCQRQDLERITLYHLHLEGALPFAEPSVIGRIFSVSLFTGPALRKPIADGLADFMPVFLSDIPRLFHTRQLALDAVLLQLSPPDAHGYCSLGTSVDAARAAFDSAPVALAEINLRMPRTHGNTMIHIDQLDAFCVCDRPLLQAPLSPEGAVEATIGEIIADLIEDRSTLQMGVGGIPNAVLARLKQKHDLGVHTEMFSDHLIDLFEQGVITNRFKNVHPGVIVTSFVTGSQRLFDFVNDNPIVQFLPCDRTNDTALIRKNPKVVAINSALEVDLSGQVCADSLGHQIYSGIGGQMDFIRGAALSEGGKPIIALPATAKHGTVSRINPELKPGAGVVTTRGHVHWVVTEYGAVNLFGRSLRRRAEALISIAHPDFRNELRKGFAEIRHFALPSQ